MWTASIPKYKFKVNSNAHTLVKRSRCGRFRLIVHQASLFSVCWTETKTLSLRLWGIRPEVEFDHDPVGGCNSAI